VRRCYEDAIDFLKNVAAGERIPAFRPAREFRAAGAL
jgi:hypothetical protein